MLRATRPVRARMCPALAALFVPPPGVATGTVCVALNLAPPMLCRPCLTLFLLACVLALGACAGMPGGGPLLKRATAAPELQSHGIQLVDVDAAVVQRLQALRRSESFAGSFGDAVSAEPRIGAGDALEVSLWEAPPATLFNGLGDISASSGAGSRATVLPSQVVGADGQIRVPFAGMVPVLGRNTAQVADEIVRRLTGKANSPQALVRVVNNVSSTVTVVGEVANSQRLPLSALGERLLDALAAAGGVRQPVNKMTLKLTRGKMSRAMALESVIADPRENVPLLAGDVITALHRPYAFTALGATGRNEEVEFEAQGISLAQALARTGGLTDQRADARGVFVFRHEAAKEGGAAQPVVYRIDMKNPAGFFVAQNFAIQPRDVLYVANAPGAELQKFLNLVLPLLSPGIATLNARN